MIFRQRWSSEDIKVARVYVGLCGAWGHMKRTCTQINEEYLSILKEFVINYIPSIK